MTKIIKLSEFIRQATDNVIEDRAATKTLLLDVMKYIASQEDRHKEVGQVAAKYLETLQRSNEQLVKLAVVLSKQEKLSQNITEEDKQDLFDLIGESES